MHSFDIGDKYILWLYVSVDDVALLKIDKRFYNLSYDHFCFHLVKILFSPKTLEQISSLTVLKHSVNILFVIEVTVESNYVWVLQPPLNLEFLFHLSEEVKLFQSSFHNNFQCDSLLTMLFDGSENLTELSGANRLDTCEVIHCPSLFFMICRDGLRIRFLHF
jgi:hypothetical protein